MSMITTLFLMERYGPRMNMEQLAHALCLAPSSLHGRIARGEAMVPTYVDGKMRYADTRDVAEYLDRLREQARQGMREAA
jgi:hypothetical protein